MKYCNKCGAESPDMGIYCIECGERLEHKKEYQVIQTTGSMVGRVNSLIVVRDPTRGIRCQVVPIEVQVFPTQGVSGRIIATGRLRVLTRESIQNVAILIRKLTGINLSKMDVHIQFLGVHGVEWDHFVLAIACAIMSDLKQLPIRQDLAMMGSLSVSAEVLPVRNVTTMIEEASTVGIKDIIIPAANIENISLDEDVREKLNIIPVKILEEALKIAMDSHSSNHHVFCPFRIQKQDSKAGCVLKLGKETLCYTQDLYPLLFDDGRYYCPELQFKLSAAIYKETETYINSILNIYDEENIARNLWAIISDQKAKKK
ncbi:S16 family serine protease [Candidatus Hodarchaeum mangrovi]